MMQKYCNAETRHHFMQCNERHLVSEITSEMWSSWPGMKTEAMGVCDMVVLGKPRVRILGVQPEFCCKGEGVESPCQMGCGSSLVNMNHY